MIGIRSVKALLTIGAVLLLGVSLGVLVSTSTQPSSAIGNNEGKAMHAVTDPTRPADTIIRQGEDLHSGGRPSSLLPDRYLGVTFARQAADIVARTEGRLDAVYVSLGDHLRAGDIIPRIEPSAISQQLSIAESSVRSSEAEEKSARLELEEAEHRYSRRETLAEAGILSREELASARVLVERAKNQLEVARARVSEQIARVDEAKESLAHTHVRASFTGTVSVRYLDPGATVRPGVPIINLTRSSDVWVRVAIPLTKL